ncbi:MAG: response regulator transcription factor [Turicibacter sp.]|nr:response regulator transcription factor [Turicibacter sp.]
MAKILIVEDEKAINTLIRKNLELVGHKCISVFDGSAVNEVAEMHDFDLMLLDIMLPGADGFQVIGQLIKEIPVIFLTARDAVGDKIRGLNLGAYDYMVKPFDMLELQARVEAVLRRTQKTANQFKLGEVVVEMEGRLVWFKGNMVDFTPQEFNLIEALIRNRNIALSREKLLDIAWGFDYLGDTRTVDVHIHTIRKKLEWEDVIKTVYKLGYRLEVPR